MIPIEVAVLADALEGRMRDRQWREGEAIADAYALRDYLKLMGYDIVYMEEVSYD
jgi:hypothetical protein